MKPYEPPPQPLDPGYLTDPNSSSPASGSWQSQVQDAGIDLSGLTAGGVSGDDPQVFFGYYRGGPSGARPAGEDGLRRKNEPNYRRISSIMNEIYGSWSREKIAALGAKLVAANLLSPQDAGNLPAIGDAYQKFLQLVADRNASGLLITPDDLLQRFIRSGTGSGMPASYTTTTKDVELTNPESARALMVQTLQQRLGRDPTAAEQQGFLAALHAAERKDPTIRTSTYNYNSSTGQYELTNQTTQGGVDAGAYAADFGSHHNQKEYGAYQAAATYMPALFDALSATVG